jgi:hypothetical protein
VITAFVSAPGVARPHRGFGSVRNAGSIRAWIGGIAVAAAAVGLDAIGADLEPAPAELIAAEIVDAAEATLRGDRCVIDAKLTVPKRKRARARTLHLRVQDDREGGRSFVRVLGPEQDAGVAMLKLPPNIWTWSPEEQRHARIARAAWHEPWMGSDFDVADLLHTGALLGDYRHRLLGIDPQPDGQEGLRAYVIESLPRGPTGGRIVHWIEIAHATPLRREFYAEDGSLARVIRYGDIRVVQGRWFPHAWHALRAKHEGEESRFFVQQVRFDPKFDATTFTTGRLRSSD